MVCILDGGGSILFLLLFYFTGNKSFDTPSLPPSRLFIKVSPLLPSSYFHHDQTDIKHPLCCSSLKSKLHHVSFSRLPFTPCHSEVSIHRLSVHICSPSPLLDTSLLVCPFSFLLSLTRAPSCHRQSAPNCHHLTAVTHAPTLSPCPQARFPSSLQNTEQLPIILNTSYCFPSYEPRTCLTVPHQLIKLPHIFPFSHRVSLGAVHQPSMRYPQGPQHTPNT